MYAMGQTDEVKGTGVWSAFKLKRDTNEESQEENNEKKKDNDEK